MLVYPTPISSYLLTSRQIVIGHDLEYFSQAGFVTKGMSSTTSVEINFKRMEMAILSMQAR
jgi:hypothetical protein